MGLIESGLNIRTETSLGEATLLAFCRYLEQQYSTKSYVGKILDYVQYEPLHQGIKELDTQIKNMIVRLANTRDEVRHFHQIRLDEIAKFWAFIIDHPELSENQKQLGISRYVMATTELERLVGNTY